MRAFIKLLLFVLLASAAPAAAYVPVPTPDPEALAAARLLVADLPVEDFSFFPTTERVADELAGEWLRYQPGLPEGIFPETVRQVLAQRLRAETAQAVPALLAEIEERYAIHLALRYSVEQIEALRAFHAGPHGGLFAQDRVIDSSQLHAIVADAVRRAVTPRVERLAAESVESIRLISEVNRGR
jgi:hypothetical protein